MNKICTSIEQSKKLIELGIDVYSADMWYHGHGSPLESKREYDSYACPSHSIRPNWDVPAWSLAALLEGLSKWAESISEAGIVEISYEKGTKWGVSILNCGKIKDCYADNPIDACYEMIIKLHKMNLL